MRNYKYNNTTKLTAAAILTTVLSMGLCTGCSAPAPQPVIYQETGTYFDTVITITVYDKQDSKLIQDCFDMAGHYEDLFSRTVTDSDVSKINQNAGDYVTVDAETIELIQDGLAYCEKTDGVFDITVGALSDLWDISNNPGVIPDENDIQSARDTIDYHSVQIQDNQVCIANPGTMLDLGAIAKGYIADKMKEYLLEQGVTSALINLGGNTLVIGNKPDDTPYKIGIQKPFDETNAALAALSITDQTVVTSGNYERFFEKDGRIYHHIMDTSTGYPVENNLLSVTIICEKSVDGDGLSTTCYSLGLEKGLELIESLPDTEAIFVTSDNELHYSTGIGNTIPIQLMD